jgi:hypothetical protein
MPNVVFSLDDTGLPHSPRWPGCRDDEPFVARPSLSLGELIEHWTLVGQEIDLVSAKQRDTRLTFALLLKFYGRHGRFPRSRGELHPDAVEFVSSSIATPVRLRRTWPSMTRAGTLPVSRSARRAAWV